MPLQNREFGNFTFIPTVLEAVTIIQPKVRGDERGYFFESYQHDSFSQAGITAFFIQDNHSSSSCGIFRGLHLQYPIYQEKIVRVVCGDVLDFAVQIFPENHPNFGRMVAVPLSASNHHQLHIGQSSYRGEPVIYAHGFLVTSNSGTEVCYKASADYKKEDELGLNPFDPDIVDNKLTRLDPEQMCSDGLINQRDFNWPGLHDLAAQIWERVPERRKIITVKKHGV
jgi:dTDP-4-dehydrorhamnose 3,5-epimerase